MIMQVTGMCWCSGGVLCFNLARDDSTGGYEVGYYDALGTYIWETWPRYICGDTGVGVNVVFAAICGDTGDGGDFAGVCVSGGVDGGLLVFGVIGLAPLGSASLLHSSGEKPPCCQLDDGRPTVRRP